MSCSIYVISFLLLCIAPAGAARQKSPIVPNLIAPENGAVLDNGCAIDKDKDGVFWKFEWERVPKAKRYHLLVYGATAKLPAIDEQEIKATSFLKEDRGSYIADQFSKGWRWRVRALVSRKWSEWSPERTFDVEPLNTDCPRQ